MQTAVNIRCYPNLVAAGGNLQLHLPFQNTGSWHYSILNAAGQIVAQNSLTPDTSTGKASLRLPEGLAAGTYCLSLQQPGKEATALMLTLQ